MNIENNNYITISDLTRYIKAKFDMDAHLENVFLRGEISNFKHHTRGHLYFTLKDETSRLSAVMFASSAKNISFEPEDGMKVLVTGRISVYEATGSYQIYVSEMQLDGIGNLYLEYEKLKKKLAEEGLFAPEHKRPIPRYPKKIGIITAPTGAAIRDILSTIKRRYPICETILFPALVQGVGAKESIVAQLEKAQNYDLDVIICGRGGGSIEDLWAFNEEIVARAIYNSKIPVISAVGHEIDFTIADFVSDFRAATPTAAAAQAVDGWVHAALHVRELGQRQKVLMQRAFEISRMRLAKANRLRFALRALLAQARTRLAGIGDFRRLVFAFIDRLSQQLDNLQDANTRAMQQRLEFLQNRVRISQARLVARKPQASAEKVRLLHAQEMLSQVAHHQLQMKKERLESLAARLQALDVARVLRRGYCLALDAEGKPIADAGSLVVEQEIGLLFSNGSARAEIKQIEH